MLIFAFALSVTSNVTGLPERILAAASLSPRSSSTFLTPLPPLPPLPPPPVDVLGAPTTTSPLTSTATHKAGDGQDTPSRATGNRLRRE